jgi:F-type H+-transporting ATPase subunit epsilon
MEPMALPTTLTLEIVTPERALAHEQVDEIHIPGSQGYLGVLPGHTPLLATLQVGEAWYRQGDEVTYLSVAFGFAEVLPDRVTILAQIVERAEEIDVARAETAARRARERLDRPVVDMDFERARVALMKSMSRMQVASRIRVKPKAGL